MDLDSSNKIANNLFEKLIPYYHVEASKLPCDVKLILMLNHLPSVAVACNEIANNSNNPSIRKKLHHVMAFKN